MKDTRLPPDMRKDQIITMALQLAAGSHYLKLTRDAIAEKLHIRGPAIQYHFGTMANMRRDIMRAAIKREDLVVLSQGLLAKDNHAGKAPPELRERAINHVSLL